METLEKIPYNGKVPPVKYLKIDMLLKEYDKKACKYQSFVKATPQENLRMTVPLVSYIRNSLRFWYYASLGTCCQNLEKKLGSPGKFGRKRGSNF